MFRIRKFPAIDKFDILFFSIPLLSLIMIEYASRGSVIDIVYWLIESPVSFLISLILFYSVYIFLWANLNHRGAAAITFSIIWLALSCVIGNKREILGTTLAPWDITVGSNAAKIIENVNPSQLTFFFDWVFIVVLAVNIAIAVMILIFQKGKYLKVKNCNILTVMTCVIIGTIILTLPNISLVEASASCDKDGFVRGFIENSKLWSKMNNPGSDPSAVSGNDTQYQFTSGKATSDIKPNVIFVMSESFIDITAIPNLTFSEDPIPNFHALSKEGVSGEMVTNTYGGLTDNVEFEVMTGFSMKYLPYQANSYTTIVKKPIPALPAYFKSLGYQTIAVHPYESAFFNRNTVYPLLGIDNFITLEDMPDARKKGIYVSDDSFADYVISEFDKSQHPAFMYNISVQNHWPYTTENYYKNYDIEVKSSNDLDKESMTALRNFTQGLHDADASLKRITDYFRTVKEPTVVIFFGDHFPSLTAELSVYKKLGFINEALSDTDFGDKGIDAADKRFMQSQELFKMPYLIWSNYEMKEGKGKTLSASYLGINALSEIGMELPPFYNFLLDYSGKLPVNRYFILVDSSGMPLDEVPAIYRNYESVYQNVQNDILFGAQNNKELFEVK